MPSREEQLKSDYAAMLARRSIGRDPPAVPPETVQALAEGTYRGADREALLESVLSDARTAAEFQFFMDVARARPLVPVRVIRLAAAAAVILALGTAGVWLAARAPDAEPLRSGTELLLQPAAGAAVSASTPFVWHRVAGAEDFRFELVAEDGVTVHEATTQDTTLLLPASVVVRPGPHVWWVSARLRDGSQSRSTARPVSFR